MHIKNAIQTALFSILCLTLLESAIATPHKGECPQAPRKRRLSVAQATDSQEGSAENQAPLWEISKRARHGGREDGLLQAQRRIRYGAARSRNLASTSSSTFPSERLENRERLEKLLSAQANLSAHPLFLAPESSAPPSHRVESPALEDGVLLEVAPTSTSALSSPGSLSGLLGDLTLDTPASSPATK